MSYLEEERAAVSKHGSNGHSWWWVYRRPFHGWYAELRVMDCQWSNGLTTNPAETLTLGPYDKIMTAYAQAERAESADLSMILKGVDCDCNPHEWAG